MYVCMHVLLKIGGFEMCDVDVWQSVTEGGGSKLAQNSVTLFMHGPKKVITWASMSDFACSLTEGRDIN